MDKLHSPPPLTLASRYILERRSRDRGYLLDDKSKSFFYIQQPALQPSCSNHNSIQLNLILITIKMFRVAAILASFAGVAAFAPAGRMAASTSLKMGFEDALGAQPPLGFWVLHVLWDTLL